MRVMSKVPIISIQYTIPNNYTLYINMQPALYTLHDTYMGISTQKNGTKRVRQNVP